MPRIRPFHVGAALLVATLLLIVLNAMEWPRPAPDTPSSLSLLRLLIGLPVVLFAPAFFFVPKLFRKDVGRPGASGELDPGWMLLAALGLNLPIHALHFNVLRVLDLPIRWPALLAITAVECVAGLILLRRAHPDLRFGAWEPGLKRAFGAVCLLLVGFGAWSAPHLLRDGSWYFFHPSVLEGWEATVDRDSVSVAWDDGPLEDGVTAYSDERVMPLQVVNSSVAHQSVPVVLAVHAPVGSTVSLLMGDEVLGREQIANMAPIGGDGPLVERYWEWGTAAMVARLQAPPQGQATLNLVVDRPAGHEQVRIGVAGWSKLSTGELLDALGTTGHHHMHPFQLLNVTENVRWAAEVAGEHPLAGRSPDGSSTLHQPPAWTYLYAPAREMLCDQTVSAGLLLLLILLGIGTVGLLGIRDEGATPPVELGLVLGLAVLQHGRLMVSDGSLNFPDSLYALALVVSTVALVSGRVRVFIIWALLASVLRYPGAVVVAMSGFCLLALDPGRRKRIIDALVRFGFGIAIFCGLMLLAGLATRKIDTWLFALYFETIPEHFNNNPDALPILERPIEFLRLWALFGGGVLLVAIPFRSRLSKVALGTALLYAPLLAFIDHFSHHYFLPLVGLAGVSATASVAKVESEGVRRGLSMAMVVLAAGLFAWSAGNGL